MQIFITNLECLFQLFVVVVWNFELYMLPLGLLLLLVWNFLFSSSRDTPDMVSKYKRNCDISPDRSPLEPSLWLSFPQQSMEAMFEWEDEDEDKDEKVARPLCFASHQYFVQNGF